MKKGYKGYDEGGSVTNLMTERIARIAGESTPYIANLIEGDLGKAVGKMVPPLAAAETTDKDDAE